MQEQLWHPPGKLSYWCCWLECKTVQLLWKAVGCFIKRLNAELFSDPPKSISRYLSKRNKDIFQRKTYTRMHIVALFMIAPKWKPPKCPLAHEKMNEVWHGYTREYYLALKRNEVETHVIT